MNTTVGLVGGEATYSVRYQSGFDRLVVLTRLVRIILEFRVGDSGHCVTRESNR